VYGGGLLLDTNSDATLNGNTVFFNQARSYGGGVLLYDTFATLRNTVIADNQASTKGGGLLIVNSKVYALHTTLARNKVINNVTGSGVLVERYSARTTAWLTNTILVSHTVGISVTAGATATLESTLWGSGAWANGSDWGGAGGLITGTNNFWGDPVFAADGYHITVGSAARGKGVNAGVTTDVDGELRHNPPDLGADEYNYPYHLYLPLVIKN